MSTTCETEVSRSAIKKKPPQLSPLNFEKFAIAKTQPDCNEMITLSPEILQKVEDEVEQRLLSIKPPINLILGQYDYIVICSSKDQEKAKKYSDQVNQLYRLKGLTIHEPPFTLIPRIVDRLLQAHERASRCFFFLSPSFIMEIMLTMHRNEAIWNLFTDPSVLNRGSVILVHSESVDEDRRSYEVPDGLISHMSLEADKVVEEQQKISSMFYPLVFKRREGKEKTELHKKRIWELETRAKLRKEILDRVSEEVLKAENGTHMNGNGIKE